jgi:hypothetical protein
VGYKALPPGIARNLVRASHCLRGLRRKRSRHP